jgi:hypothetical protein
MQDPARDAVELAIRQASTALQDLSRSLPIEQNSTKRQEKEQLAEQAVKKARLAVDGYSSKDTWVLSKFAADIYRLEGELKRIKLLSSSTYSDPIMNNSNNSDDADVERDAKNRVLRSTNLLNQSNTYIADSTRLMNESRNMGNDTLSALQDQERQLLDVHDNVSETQNTTKKARHVLRRMATRALYNRVFLWSVIVVLFIADVLFLYFGFLKKK